jgi:hypothetical protein
MPPTANLPVRSEIAKLDRCRLGYVSLAHRTTVRALVDLDRE